MLEFDFNEQDPIGNPPPSAQRSPQPEAYPVKALPYFKDQTPYTYAMVGDQGRLPGAGVGIDASNGLLYDCVKMQTGLQNKCDTIFWMAPGRPQDMGSAKNNPYESGVWIQQRMSSDNVSAAGSAPYSGIYTGLQGYIEMVAKE